MRGDAVAFEDVVCAALALRDKFLVGPPRLKDEAVAAFLRKRLKIRAGIGRAALLVAVHGHAEAEPAVARLQHLPQQIIQAQAAALAVDAARPVGKSVSVHLQRPLRAGADGEDRVHVCHKQHVDLLVLGVARGQEGGEVVIIIVPPLGLKTQRPVPAFKESATAAVPGALKWPLSMAHSVRRSARKADRSKSFIVGVPYSWRRKLRISVSPSSTPSSR